MIGRQPHFQNAVLPLYLVGPCTHRLWAPLRYAALPPTSARRDPAHAVFPALYHHSPVLVGHYFLSCRGTVRGRQEQQGRRICGAHQGVRDSTPQGVPLWPVSRNASPTMNMRDAAAANSPSTPGSASRGHSWRL